MKRARKWNIPDRLRRILLDLAEKGPASGYSLADRVGIPTSSSYDGLKILLEWGFVDVRVDPEWTGALKKKEYGLTIRGFSVASMLADLEILRSFPAAWPELLPLVTGKWSLFVEAGVEELALPRLKWSGVSIAIPELVNHLQRFLRIPAPSSLTDEERVTRIFYDPEAGFFSPEDRLRWAAGCAGDPEVREYLTERLKESIEAHASSMQEAEIMIQVLQGEEER